MGWFGKWFGERLDGARYKSKWFGRWFPERRPAGVIPPVTPSTASSLILEDEVKATWTWQTGLSKTFDGREFRSFNVEDPAAHYDGTILLDKATTRYQRGSLARNAANGSAFALGLPWESVPIIQDSTGATAYVNSTASIDWAVPGARAIVRHLAYGSIECVVQGKTSDTIVLYIPSAGALGNIGLRGAVIMPAAAVFLDAQQGFQRYRVNLERWQIGARNANNGVASSAVAASLALSDVTADTALASIVIEARASGADGNAITVQFIGDGTTLGSLTENTGAKTIVVHFSPGNTPVGRLVNMFATSTLCRVIGANGSLLKINGTFAATALSGGINAGVIEPGLGATLTTFADKPVWDRGIDTDDTTSESIQSMVDPQDLGGLPFTAPTARMADWGRTVTCERELRDDWQWVKKFLWTIKGSYRSWWLPTYREDLVPISVTTGTLTVSSAVADGDFFAWWPLQRQFLACVSASGMPTYVKIASATDNGDGTVTLSLVDDADAPVTLTATPAKVCWLDLCRLEGDSVTVQFSSFQFSTQLQARVIQYTTRGDQPGFLGDEDGIETSIPREGIEFILPAVTYRVSTGTRDIVIDGQTYTAYPSARDEVGVITSGDSKDVTVRLPLKHAVPQRYLQGGVPPKRVQVNIYRQQQASGAYELVFSGDVDSMGAEGRVAMLRCRSAVNRLMETRLPVITVSRSCAYILYDRNCDLDENSFKLSTTVADVNGRVVTMAITLPDDYATAGKLKHTASGEQMTIQSQVGFVVTMQLAIPDLKVGDAIDVFAGCKHTVSDCRLKFNNKPNFGGAPQLVTENPFGPKNNGIYTSQ